MEGIWVYIYILIVQCALMYWMWWLDSASKWGQKTNIFSPVTCLSWFYNTILALPQSHSVRFLSLSVFRTCCMPYYDIKCARWHALSIYISLYYLSIASDLIKIHCRFMVECIFERHDRWLCDSSSRIYIYMSKYSYFGKLNNIFYANDETNDIFYTKSTSFFFLIFNE